MGGEKTKRIKVSGKNNKHKVLMYALSTCAWCRMTKNYLKENEVEYEYVDVVLCSDKDRAVGRKYIESRGGEPNYPIIIVDDKTIINGFRKDKIGEALGI